MYRWRDNFPNEELASAKLDNRWVVPYNPYLCLKFNVHINVEICDTASAAKYLYNYVYKGHDRALILSLEDPEKRREVDEASNYLEARHASGCEA